MSNKINGKKKLCRVVSVLMCISLCVSTFVFPAKALASTSKEDLITNLKNSANAELSFYVYVPAKTTANYTIKLVPNNKNSAIDSLSGSVKNTGTEAKKIKVTRTVNYYSSKYSYSVKANYNYKKTNYVDTDTVKSLIPSKTFYSNKFTWTEENIKAYKNNKRVEILLAFGTGIAIDVLATKGYVTTALASAYTFGSLASDLVATNADSDIRNTAIKGWGYKIKAVPNSSGTEFTTYLLTYNKDGKLADTTKCGTVKISPYCKVIK